MDARVCRFKKLVKFFCNDKTCVRKEVSKSWIKGDDYFIKIASIQLLESILNEIDRILKAKFISNTISNGQ
jgi:hypothetical protein